MTTRDTRDEQLSDEAFEKFAERLRDPASVSRLAALRAIKRDRRALKERAEKAERALAESRHDPRHAPTSGSPWRLISATDGNAVHAKEGEDV